MNVHSTQFSWGASEYVRWVQSALNQIMALHLPIDGVMGAETRSAIRSFQKRQGLPVDGAVGPDSERALIVARGAELPQPQPTEVGELAYGPQRSQASQVNRSSPEYVRWVQQSLNGILGLRLAVDGVNGPMTNSAIRSFQQRRKLTVDGIVGPQTEAALIAAGAPRPSGSSAAGGGAGCPSSSRTPLGIPTPPDDRPDISGPNCYVLTDFEFGKATLKQPQQAKISEIARRIIASQSASQPVRKLLIVGHTDPVGSPEYNIGLGKRRAEEVALALGKAMDNKQRGSSSWVSLDIQSWGETPIGDISDPAELRRVTVCLDTQPCVMAPPSSSSLPPLPKFRGCCMLSPDPRYPFADPKNLGQHGSSNEVNGQLYSGMAGFLDLGHIRFTCDMTKFVYDQLMQVPMPKTIVVSDSVFSYGKAVMNVCPSLGQHIGVARAIAYDAGLGHELSSYWRYYRPGYHMSAFSPEDLCSNFLGTLVAERAIAAGGNFNTTVTKELDKLIRIELKGRTPLGTRQAFSRINGCWVKWSDSSGIGSYLNLHSYLKRRNFTRVPWKTGHASDTTTPSFVLAPMPNVTHMYSYTHKEKPGNRTIPGSSFAAEMDRIRQHASSYYGPQYDQPSCP